MMSRSGWTGLSTLLRKTFFLIPLLLLIVTFDIKNVHGSTTGNYDLLDEELSTMLPPSTDSKVNQLDFHPDYKTLVAQAVHFARCCDQENEELPKLDDASLIMKPGSNKRCMEVRVAKLNASELLTNGPLTYERELEAPKPVFHCTSHILNHEKDFETFFRMEYINHQPPSESSDFLPRLFVVEKEVDGVWESVKLQYYWMFGLETRNQSTYRIRVTAVSPKYIYYPQLSEPIQLYDGSIQSIGTPQNLRVVKTFINTKTSRPGVVVLVRWEGGSGKNTSCDFDLHYMADESLKLERKGAQEAFWAMFETKSFETNFKINVIEKSGYSRESKAARLEVNVPSCLEMQNFNFSLCPPPSPRNVRIENETEKSFWIAWDHPQNHSRDNQILSYELSVNRIPIVPSDIGLFKSHKPVFKGQVNGNTTAVEIRNTTINGKIHVIVSATSRGGESSEAWLTFHLKGHLALGRHLEKVWIVVLVVFVVLMFLMGILYAKNFRDRLRRKKEIKERFENLDKEPTQQVDRYASKWEIESGSLFLGDVIGQGQFGLVRKATFHHKGSKRIVAVKTLRDVPGSKDSDKFWEEFEILKGLDPHNHVVGLVGIVKHHVPALVVEYCDGGDLKTHLRTALQSTMNKRRPSPCSSTMGSSVHLQSNEIRVQLCMVTNEAYFLKDGAVDSVECPLTSLDLLSYARQIACGMEWLNLNKVIHRDLAARNILISGPNRTLKIADFGLSRDVYEQNWYKKSSNGKIPIKWLAVECLLQEVYTTKSDVWSFGILLWEIVTFGGNPYPGVDNTKIFDLLKAGYRMPKPENCLKEMYDLMTICWDENPTYRPDFTSIRLKLEELIGSSNYATYLSLDSGIRETSFADSSS